jgi:nucleotide-binding universal stress UspA family protein
MRILVPIDGSRYSMRSIEVAVDYAKEKISSIYLLTILPISEGIDLELSPVENEHIKEGLRQKGEEILGMGRQILEQKGISHIRTALSFASSPGQEIVEFAGRENIDLIVMGSSGLSPAKRFFLGSVAAHVVTYSPCSVYVVRGKC